MSKTSDPIDVLVVGDHPAGHLASALLAHDSGLRIAHATLSAAPQPDRLVRIHPSFFLLHPLLEPLRHKIPANPIYGVRFLADDGAASEHRSPSPLAGIAELSDVRDAVEKVATSQKVICLKPKSLHVRSVDEHGLEIELGSQILHPKALVISDPLPGNQTRTLGIPEEWESGVLHRYALLQCNPGRSLKLSARPLLPVSLSLKNLNTWAWLLPGKKTTQLCVELPDAHAASPPPLDLLRHWIAVLVRHGILTAEIPCDAHSVRIIELPTAGALAHEGVANRTLLIGPAGGFYSATAEDVYPNCWSAVFAADILKKALKQKHLQDALQPFRHVWRTTLGNHLRGPQENLRFLLPMVFRNSVMTTRMAEGILIGRHKGP
jgi:hypothetical protein